MLEKVSLNGPIRLMEYPMLEKVSLNGPIWLMEYLMLENVSLIQLKSAIWDQYARIRCTKSH